MIRPRVAAAVLGLAFGFLLSWVGMTDPDMIRRMLLLEDAYLFLVFFSAVAVAFVGVHALRWRNTRSLLTGERVSWTTARPERRHVGGSVVFGAGWAIASTCPGPVAAQLGQGMVWSVFTTAGIVLGVVLHSLRQRSHDGADAAPGKGGAAWRSTSPSI